MTHRHYLRCDECGVDAGRACRDDDDALAIEVCDGRVLRVPGTYRPQSLRGEASPGYRVPRPKKPTTLVLVPCRCCGLLTPPWGGVDRGRTWCLAPLCRADRVEVKRLADNERRRTPRLPDTACFWCHAVLSHEGRSPRVENPCCDRPDCVRARKRIYAAAKRHRNTVTTLTT